MKLLNSYKVLAVPVLILLCLSVFSRISPRVEYFQTSSVKKTFSPFGLKDPRFYVLNPDLIEEFKKLDDRVAKRGFGLGFYQTLPLIKTNHFDEIRGKTDFSVISNVLDRDTLKANAAEVVSWGLVPIISLNPDLISGDLHERNLFLDYVLDLDFPGTRYVNFGQDWPGTPVELGDGWFKNMRGYLVTARERIIKTANSKVKLGMQVNYEFISGKLDGVPKWDKLSKTYSLIDFIALSSYPGKIVNDSTLYYSDIKNNIGSKEVIFLGIGIKEEYQQDFIKSFPNIAKMYGVTKFIWRNLYDVPQDGMEVYQSGGLLTRDGAAKKSLSSWLDVYNK